MKKKNNMPLDEEEFLQQPKQKKKKKKKGSGLFGRIVRRFFLVIFTIVILVVVDLCLAMNLVFKGPSDAARELLTMTLLEPSATKWIPGLFIGDEMVQQIKDGAKYELQEEVTNTDMVTINLNSAFSGGSNEFANYPDGVYFEDYAGRTFNAHIMVIQDPSNVYMGTSTEKFTTAIPGKRLNEVMAEADDTIIAAVNAGAFNDDGTANTYVGSCPAGLVYAGGKMVWNAGDPPAETGGGFVGFTDKNILVVAKSMTEDKAAELGIRDGCEFGPPLIINGEINMDAYSNASGLNPRTAIGQRDDGAVIFVCIDGRQAGSPGGTYADVIDIMIEYGAVNACNLDGGSSSIMMYRDMYGLYGTAGEVQTMNSYSVLQSQPRRMPNYWLVKTAASEE